MRYTMKDLLTWGQDHSYPQLILSAEDILRHGEMAWRRMARDKERRAMAWKRVQQWNALACERIA